MGKDIITFSYIPEDGDNVTISFTIPEEHNIYTFHRLCKMAAAAFGYMEQTIENAFGETVYEEE